MESIVLTINGQRVSCPSGASLFNAAEQNGVSIPSLCHHPDLKPYGACRLCLVEDAATGRLMASCVTPAANGMSILTHSPRVLNHRRNIIRLMMAEHPESCIVCNKGNRCELRGIAADLGVGESGLYPMPNPIPLEQLNPFITRDLSKCILCGKCIRADHELVVAGAIDYNHRGFRSRPATLHERPLEESTCTFCGTCVSICPTGALSAKNMRYVGTPEQETEAVCGFCGAGCSLSLGVSGNMVMDVNPSRRQMTVNGATLCIRGHFANDYLNAPDRLTQPLVRNADTHVPDGWDEAVSLAAARLSDVRRTHGPASIAFIGSSKCSNEENYLFQKIARDIFNTPHVMSGAWMSGGRLLAKIDAITFGACRVSPLKDLENSETIVMVNADPETIVPVAGYHIKRAVKNGARLIAIDDAGTDLARRAALWVRPGPGGEGKVLDGLAAVISASDHYHKGFVERCCDGFDAYRSSLAERFQGHSAQRLRVPLESLNAAADLIYGKKTAFVIPANLLDFPNGEDILHSVLDLCFLTGAFKPKTSGLFVLLPEANLAGALDMGTAPGLLPGRVSITDANNHGMDPAGFVKAALSGQIRAAYVMGENPLRCWPGSRQTEAALKNLEFLVVQDIFHTRTANLAHVILPGAAFCEKHGSFTNMEGRIQTFVPAAPPPGQALPDWEILSRLCRALGHPEQYPGIETIRQEIRRNVPMYQGLGSHHQEWVRNADAGTPFSGTSARFAFFPPSAPREWIEDSAYPILARLHPVRWHLGGGTRTSRSERIRAYGKKGEISLSSDIFLSLGAHSGRVRVSSRFGAIEREFVENPRLPSKTAVISLAVSDNDALELADPTGATDGGGGWSLARVRIEKIVQRFA